MGWDRVPVKRRCNDPLGTGCRTILSRYNRGDSCAPCALEAPAPARPRKPGNCAAHRRGEKSWPAERIIKSIRDAVDAKGEVPTRIQWRRERSEQMPSDWTITQRFGSWSEAVRAAGYAPPKRAIHLLVDRPRSLSSSRLAVMAFLAAHPGAQSIEVSDHMAYTAGTSALLLLNRMERDGFVYSNCERVGKGGRRLGVRWYPMGYEMAEAAA